MDKDKEKEEGGGGWNVSTEIEIFIVIVILIALVLFSGVLSHVAWLTTPIVAFFTSPGTDSAFIGIAKTTVGSLVGLSIPVSLMLLIGIIVSVERLKKIRRKEHDAYYTPVEEAYIVPSSGTAPHTDKDNIVRWRKILAMTDSTNQNDWRQAIIESDIILDEILTKANYPGMDLGSKIRSATPADFQTVELAGEAHGIRNRIAHDGSNFLISQHEAKRVINLYRQVFEEFYYI